MDNYSAFMIDPPWPQRKGGLRKARPNQGKRLAYPTMPLEDIFSLLDTDIFPLGTSNHVVFLWTIDKFLVEADQFMLDRGYKRHVRLIWDKTNGIAPAFTIRFCHEYLVWYYKSPMLKINPALRGKFKSIFTEKAREHSRKPDIAYNLIRSFFPPPHKLLDVFSRENRNGWDTWGDQQDYFQM